MVFNLLQSGERTGVQSLHIAVNIHDMRAAVDEDIRGALDCKQSANIQVVRVAQKVVLSGISSRIIMTKLGRLSGRHGVAESCPVHQIERAHHELVLAVEGKIVCLLPHATQLGDGAQFFGES